MLKERLALREIVACLFKSCAFELEKVARVAKTIGYLDGKNWLLGVFSDMADVVGFYWKLGFVT